MRQEEILLSLKNQENLRYGEPIDRNIIDARLKKYGETRFPEDYIAFIEKMNGVVGDKGIIYGISPKSGEGYIDALQRNETDNYDGGDSVTVAEDDIVYYKYSISEKEFFAEDKSRSYVFNFYNTFEEVVADMFL